MEHARAWLLDVHWRWVGQAAPLSLTSVVNSLTPHTTAQQPRHKPTFEPSNISTSHTRTATSAGSRVANRHRNQSVMRMDTLQFRNVRCLGGAGRRGGLYARCYARERAGERRKCSA